MVLRRFPDFFITQKQSKSAVAARSGLPDFSWKIYQKTTKYFKAP
jgi:hypothetical protein